MDNPAGGVQEMHPIPGTGCSGRPDGVQPAPPRGAPRAPEPYKEPNPEPPAAARPRATPAVTAARSGPPGGCGQASDFFAALGPQWPLTAAQRARLTPAVTAALTAGWAPAGLAAFTGANAAGIRNPYAVLATRLSPAELPEPYLRRPRPGGRSRANCRTAVLPSCHGSSQEALHIYPARAR